MKIKKNNVIRKVQNIKGKFKGREEFSKQLQNDWRFQYWVVEKDCKTFHAQTPNECCSIIIDFFKK